jgi:hypothetical protein
MSTEINSGRQYPLVAVAELSFSDLPAGVATEIFELPHNAVVTGGAVTVTQVGDGGTSETYDVGDGTTGDRFIDGANAKAAARTAFTPDGVKHSGKTAITFTRIEGGTPATQGQYRIECEYIVVGRSNENQG